LTQRSAAPTIIAATAGAPPARLEALRRAGAEALVVNDGPRVDPAALMGILAGKEITSVLIEGGAAVHASALAAGIVDKVAWFIAPRIIGGREAPGPVGEGGSTTPPKRWNWSGWK